MFEFFMYTCVQCDWHQLYIHVMGIIYICIYNVKIYGTSRQACVSFRMNWYYYYARGRLLVVALSTLLLLTRTLHQLCI